MKILNKRVRSIIIMLALVLTMPNVGVIPEIIASADTYASVIEEYSINIGVGFENVPDNAIQSVAFVENSSKLPSEIYLTTRPTKGSTTYVIRCTVSGQMATAADYIALEKFGHGESLEVVKENGKTYLWLGSAAWQDGNYYWSTKISCVEYIPPASGSTKLGSHIVDSTFTVAKDGTIARDTSSDGYLVSNPNREYERVSIAFSTASICIREANSKESKYIYFNNISGGLTNANIKSALLSTSNKTVITVAAENDRVLSDGIYSYQSHDIYNGTIYVAGGRTGGVAQIRKLRASTGADRGTIDIQNNNLEMEGIKVNSEYIFYMLKPASGNKTNTKIYYIDLQ